MDNQVSIEEINSWINDLTGTLGIKEYAPRDKFVALLRSGATKECIEGIANYLELPIRVDLDFVHTCSKANGFDHNSDGFQSTTLVKTDSRGRGNAGITAQVSIPSWLPPYGSPSLRNYPIHVKVSEDCQDYTDSFVAVMAHELSHIVLASLSHPEKDNEFYTDLTAMVLGFALITKHGRRVSVVRTSGNQQITKTTTYGYLSDSQFEFAYNKIAGLLKGHLKQKKELRRQLNTLKKDWARSKKKFADFREFSACLDKNVGRRINAKDGLRIVQFHQPGYADEHAKALDSVEKVVAESEQPVLEIVHHTKATTALMKKRAEELTRVQVTLASLSQNLTEDTRVLRRNLPLLYRLKRFLIWKPEQS